MVSDGLKYSVASPYVETIFKELKTLESPVFQVFPCVAMCPPYAQSVGAICVRLCGGEGFFEDGLEEVGGVGAGTLDLGFEFAAGGHEGFDPFDDGGLLGERWEGKRAGQYLSFLEIRLLLSIVEG